MSDAEITSAVRKKYGEIARSASSCCGPTCGCGTSTGIAGQIVMNDLYESIDPAIRSTADLGLGCGTPLSYAAVQRGMTVLDLGSGAGIDAFIAAQEVGPSGKVIGVDMTPEMVSRSRINRAKLRMENTEFRLGEIEHLPVETGSIDRIISNCVINLVPDKRVAFAEMYRVLKAGGRFAVSDIVSVGTIPDAIRSDMSEWAGCVAGAIERDAYLALAREAGFADVTVAVEKEYPLDRTLPFRLLSITVTGTR